MDHPDIEDFSTGKSAKKLKCRIVEGVSICPKTERSGHPAQAQAGLRFNGEAYMTVSGQNSTIPSVFQQCSSRPSKRMAMESDSPHRRKIHKTMKARELWNHVTFGAWRCATRVPT